MQGAKSTLSSVGALGRGPTYMRVSTPANLDLALEGLVRKVLREQPKQEDIYAFAADYFETLVAIRDRAENPNAAASDICPGRSEAEAIELIKLATSFSKAEYLQPAPRADATATEPVTESKVAQSTSFHPEGEETAVTDPNKEEESDGNPISESKVNEEEAIEQNVDDSTVEAATSEPTADAVDSESQQNEAKISAESAEADKATTSLPEEDDTLTEPIAISAKVDEDTNFVDSNSSQAAESDTTHEQLADETAAAEREEELCSVVDVDNIPNSQDDDVGEHEASQELEGPEESNITENANLVADSVDTHESESGEHQAEQNINDDDNVSEKVIAGVVADGEQSRDSITETNESAEAVTVNSEHSENEVAHIMMQDDQGTSNDKLEDTPLEDNETGNNKNPNIDHEETTPTEDQKSGHDENALESKTDSELAVSTETENDENKVPTEESDNVIEIKTDAEQENDLPSNNIAMATEESAMVSNNEDSNEIKNNESKTDVNTQENEENNVANDEIHNETQTLCAVEIVSADEDKDIIKEFIDREKDYATMGNCTRSLEVVEVYPKSESDTNSLASVKVDESVEAGEEGSSTSKDISIETVKAVSQDTETVTEENKNTTAETDEAIANNTDVINSEEAADGTNDDSNYANNEESKDEVMAINDGETEDFSKQEAAKDPSEDNELQEQNAGPKMEAEEDKDDFQAKENDNKDGRKQSGSASGDHQDEEETTPEVDEEVNKKETHLEMAGGIILGLAAVSAATALKSSLDESATSTEHNYEESLKIADDNNDESKENDAEPDTTTQDEDQSNESHSGNVKHSEDMTDANESTEPDLNNCENAEERQVSDDSKSVTEKREVSNEVNDTEEIILAEKMSVSNSQGEEITLETILGEEISDEIVMTDPQDENKGKLVDGFINAFSNSEISEKDNNVNSKHSEDAQSSLTELVSNPAVEDASQLVHNSLSQELDPNEDTNEDDSIKANYETEDKEESRIDEQQLLEEPTTVSESIQEEIRASINSEPHELTKSNLDQRENIAANLDSLNVSEITEAEEAVDKAINEATRKVGLTNFEEDEQDKELESETGISVIDEFDNAKEEISEADEQNNDAEKDDKADEKIAQILIREGTSENDENDVVQAHIESEHTRRDSQNEESNDDADKEDILIDEQDELQKYDHPEEMERLQNREDPEIFPEELNKQKIGPSQEEDSHNTEEIESRIANQQALSDEVANAPTNSEWKKDSYQSKSSKDTGSLEEENPFISAEVRTLVHPLQATLMAADTEEDEADVIVPLHSDIGTIEELDEDVWGSQVSAVRAALIIQKNYRKYLKRKRARASQGSDDDCVIRGNDAFETVEVNKIRDNSSTDSSSATGIVRDEIGHEFSRNDTAIEKVTTTSLTEGRRLSAKESPRSKREAFAVASRTIDDNHVWSALEQELDAAATTIQHSFKDYKDRQRERLRREDAVQITSEESATESPKMMRRLQGTGELHDVIVPQDHHQ